MTRALEITRVDVKGVSIERDDVAVEEPLEIRVEGEVIAIAMRAPGQDRELVAGWLVSEGIVRSRAEISDLIQKPGDEAQSGAMVDVVLRDRTSFKSAKYRRQVLTNASCGLCGAASIEAVLRDCPPLDPGFTIETSVLHALPGQLQSAQAVFQKTGGTHACAIFTRQGQLIYLREDVGRHNALDKLVGAALLEGNFPLSEQILLLSGRVSFEMVQKAAAARIPVIAALGAPSSLAIDLARSARIGLAAFLKPHSVNLYAAPERFLRDGQASAALPISARPA